MFIRRFIDQASVYMHCATGVSKKRRVKSVSDPGRQTKPKPTLSMPHRWSRHRKMLKVCVNNRGENDQGGLSTCYTNGEDV